MPLGGMKNIHNINKLQTIYNMGEVQKSITKTSLAKSSYTDGQYLVGGESLEELPSIWVEIFKKSTFCIVIQARIDFSVSHMPNNQPRIL